MALRSADFFKIIKGLTFLEYGGIIIVNSFSILNFFDWDSNMMQARFRSYFYHIYIAIMAYLDFYEGSINADS